MPQVSDIANRLLSDNVNNIATNVGSWGQTPIAPRESFFNFLERWETSIPLQSLWMVFFDIPGFVKRNDGVRSIDSEMQNWGEYVVARGGGKNFSTGTARKRLLKEGNIGYKTGIAFATSINIPGESSEIGSIGPNNRGFLRDPIMQQRTQLQPISVNFLETNMSFVDHLIRPWLILSTHMGFVARKSALSNYGGLATTITAIQFAKMGTMHRDLRDSTLGTYGPNIKGMEPRKIFIFKDAVPVKVDNQDMSYGIDNDLQKRAVEFQYRRYQVFFPDQVLDHIPSAEDEHKEVSVAFKKRISADNLKPRRVYNTNPGDDSWGNNGATGKAGVYDNLGRLRGDAAKSQTVSRQKQHIDASVGGETRANLKEWKTQSKPHEPGLRNSSENMDYGQALGSSRVMYGDEMANQEAQAASGEDWPGATGPAAVHETSPLGSGDENDGGIIGSGKSNMRNIYPPKKIKGGSGIFGLLGF